MIGFHGGLIYPLGIMPLVYGQAMRAQGCVQARQQFISDMVQGYLAQVAFALPYGHRATGKASSTSETSKTSATRATP